MLTLDYSRLDITFLKVKQVLNLLLLYFVAKQTCWINLNFESPLSAASSIGLHGGTARVPMFFLHTSCLKQKYLVYIFLHSQLYPS